MVKLPVLKLNLNRAILLSRVNKRTLESKYRKVYRVEEEVSKCDRRALELKKVVLHRPSSSTQSI